MTLVDQFRAEARYRRAVDHLVSIAKRTCDECPECGGTGLIEYKPTDDENPSSQGFCRCADLRQAAEAVEEEGRR